LDDSELIRRVFARIEGEPEASRTALRARIVRVLRGECPASAPQQAEECSVGEARTLEELTAAGRDILARKRAEHYADRLARLTALQKTVLGDLEPELHPYIPTLREDVIDDRACVLRLEIEGYAPLLARWFEVQGEWRRECWSKGEGMALWCIPPWPLSEASMCHYVETLPEALAVAQDCYPAHLVLPAPPPLPRGWWTRLTDWIALQVGARLWMGQ